MFMALWQWFKETCFDQWFARRVEIATGDFLPTVMPMRNLVLLRDGNEDWSVGFACPCGCQRTIELLLVPDADPHWQLTTDLKGRPSLTPSVWLKGGCRSHFWIRKGQIVWCE